MSRHGAVRAGWALHCAQEVISWLESAARAHAPTPAPCGCRESGDAEKARSYLPKNKQFLITRNGGCSEWVELLDSSY